MTTEPFIITGVIAAIIGFFPFSYVAYHVIEDEKHKPLRWPFIWSVILGLYSVAMIITFIALEAGGS